ncbi:hypothetical protein ACIRQT_10780 [Streptomyces californicus]|uniref:hypothetical protein n=1 Tax=Streptomyces californicus TaxID=67351 RepID=UPI0038079847
MNCSGVDTMTAEGFSPVSRRRAPRWSVDSSGFGHLPDSGSTWAAGVIVMSCGLIADVLADAYEKANSEAVQAHNRRMIEEEVSAGRRM